MKYKILKKIYYSEPPEVYEKIYRERSSGLASVQFDFWIKEERAFLFLDPEILELVTQIYHMDKQLAKFMASKNLPPAAIDQYKEKCLIDEIVMTNGIEGVNSTRKEISEILESPQTKKKQRRFEGLVKKYQFLYEERKIPLESCADLRKLYNDSFLNEVIEMNTDNRPDGKYFRKDNVAVQNPSQKEIHTGVFPEEKIIERMTAALDYLNNGSENRLVRIAIFHYFFGYIHPFYDGNGRMSRFISSYFLREELESIVSFRLSYIIKQKVSVYYKLFDLVNDPKNMGDVTPFVIGFLEILFSAVESLYDELQEKKAEFESYQKLMEKCESFKDITSMRCGYILLQVSLFSENGILISDLAKITEKSEPTIRKYLGRLEQEHWILVNKEGNRKYYSLNVERLRK